MATMEKQDIFRSKSTLVRRVSDLFKVEGNNSRSHLLLHRSSMQKLRHCCQNLNLFPMLLYSFGQPKASLVPLSKVNIALLIAKINERINRVYSTKRYPIIRGFGIESTKQGDNVTTDETVKTVVRNNPSDDQCDESLKIFSRRCESKFQTIHAQKSKNNSLFLKFIVYLAPLLLASQLICILSLIICSKYSPGFLFLFGALLFLGFISMKVLNHDSEEVKTFKRGKRKND